MKYVTTPVRLTDRGASFGMQRVSHSRKQAARERNSILSEKDGNKQSWNMATTVLPCGVTLTQSKPSPVA